jgi:hypothetical protein
MLNQILVGAAIIVITILIHAGGMSLALRWLSMTYIRQLHLARLWTRSLVVAVP